MARRDDGTFDTDPPEPHRHVHGELVSTEVRGDVRITTWKCDCGHTENRTRNVTRP